MLSRVSKMGRLPLQRRTLAEIGQQMDAESERRAAEQKRRSQRDRDRDASVLRSHPNHVDQVSMSFSGIGGEGSYPAVGDLGSPKVYRLRDGSFASTH